jgi:murein DD-endopeptidase MepM/ murein hydrolase activator NlpD
LDILRNPSSDLIFSSPFPALLLLTKGTISMKKLSAFLMLIAFLSFSCSSTLHKIFDGNKTPHEQYADKLEDKHLDDTPQGRAWLAASQKALVTPQTIELPYRQNGYFHPDKPRSLGLHFHAKQGERLVFAINKKPSSNFILYADLFKANSTDPLLSADTSASQFSFDIEETGDYVLRLQPELFRTGEYSLSISVAPSLGFPIAYSKANIGSFWGDDRDGGKRNHEGVDIFAPKLTPAIAAADGYITGVREGGLGGKTVWLRPEGKNYTLYYAHLDQQLVKEGQLVKKGETIGLVGNTGNAKYTPSHLHFGIYTYAGAIDPLPFVNRSVKAAPQVPDKDLTTSLKLIKPKKAGDSLIKANTVLVPVAVTSKLYIAELPNGEMIQVPFSGVKAIKQEIKPVSSVATNSSASSKKS